MWPILRPLTPWWCVCQPLLEDEYWCFFSICVCQMNNSGFNSWSSCSFDVVPVIPSNTSSIHCVSVNTSVGLFRIKSCCVYGFWSRWLELRQDICAFMRALNSHQLHISQVSAIHILVFSSPGSSRPLTQKWRGGGDGEISALGWLKYLIMINHTF